ncbi:MAG: hypothetical protein ACKOBW_15845 [Planctomycetota bacterium]
MADKFDPYREALVMETNTLWPEALADVSVEERQRVEAILHSKPDQASHLEYVRVHTGFCRQITVTEADLSRARQSK